MARWRETRVERRVRKALKKYVRRTNRSGEKKRHQRMKREGWTPRVAYGHVRARARSLGAKLVPPSKANPAKVKGRKVKGGRAVTLRNFTGTVVRKANGQVHIMGRGRKK